MKERLHSLDALRGFDMLFLMGLNFVILSIFGNDRSWFLVRQMNHVAWQGFVQRDLVFPLFLFIAGLSFPFSLAAQRERGLATSAIVSRIVRRALALTLFGLLYNGVLAEPLGEVVWGSVLGQIGFAWAVSAFLFMAFGWKTRVALMAALLVGYTVVLRTFVAPDHPDLSSFSMEGNFAGWLDRMVFANAATHYYQQGLMAHVSAVATASLGMLTGGFVRGARWTGDRKALLMAAAGLVLGAAGYAADAVGLVPIVKKMWTPSFVLVAGGWSLLLFAVFYWTIDVRGWWTRTAALRAVGMNAITIYLLVRFVDFRALAGNFTSPAYVYGSEYWGNLTTSVLGFALAWSLLWFLYRKKIFLKI